MPRLGVLGWPVAHSRSPAMHNAALAALGLERLALPAAAGPAGSCSRRPCARSGAPGFVGANVTIPHKEAALALADEASDAGARDRRRQHAHASPRDGDDRAPRTPTRPGLIAALGDLAARACARSCSAPAAARARPSGRCCDAGAGEVSVWNRTASARERARARARRARGGDARSAADLLVNCTSVGLGEGPETSRQDQTEAIRPKRSRTLGH